MKRLEADVHIILDAAKISQSQFAKLIGVNLRTLHKPTPSLSRYHRYRVRQRDPAQPRAAISPVRFALTLITCS